MALTSLDPFSASFLERVVAAYPEWRAHAAASSAEPAAVVIRVPSPAKADRVLELSTERGEVTVSLDRWHEHFGWSDVPDSKAFDEALETIADLLAERVVIGVVMNGDAWVCTVTLTPGEWPEAQPPQHAYRISWLGTHDGQLYAG